MQDTSKLPLQRFLFKCIFLFMVVFQEDLEEHKIGIHILGKNG